MISGIVFCSFLLFFKSFNLNYRLFWVLEIVFSEPWIHEVDPVLSEQKSDWHFLGLKLCGCKIGLSDVKIFVDFKNRHVHVEKY